MNLCSDRLFNTCRATLMTTQTVITGSAVSFLVSMAVSQTSPHQEGDGDVIRPSIPVKVRKPGISLDTIITKEAGS
jgi:hypothetical protein